MKYSMEPKDWIYFKGYGFLCFAKNLDKFLGMSYQKKFKAASKMATQKMKGATGDLVQAKITEKIV